MSDPITVNKKLFQQDLHKHCNPWEVSPSPLPPVSGRLRITAVGAVGKVLRLFALMDLFQVRRMFFQKRMPKITKNAKERGKGDLSRIYE